MGTARVGVRGKLVGVAVLLILAVAMVSGLWLEGRLTQSYTERTEHSLREKTEAFAEAVGGASGEELNALTKRFGEILAVRLTVVADDGRVLADSSVTPRELPALDNHGNRPEVLQAQQQGSGVSRRYSTTLRMEMAYHAVRLQEAPFWTVRGAVSVEEIETAIWGLRRGILVASLLGILVAGFVTMLASHWITRDFMRLVRYSRALSEEGQAEETAELPLDSRDEVGSLARSLYSLSKDRDRVTQEMSSQLVRFEELLQLMEAGAILFDQRWIVLRANPAAERLMGVSDLRGRSLVEITRSPGIHQLTESGKSETAEIALPAPSTSRVLASMSYPESLPGGILLMQDITAMRRLEQVRSDFVSNASHELRTPVGIIRANAEALMDGALEDPKAAEMFSGSILRNSERLSTLVNDLLDLSRIESAAAPLSLRPLELHEVVVSAAEDLQFASEAKGIGVDIQVPEELHVMADKDSLSRVVANLVDNAIRHIPEGSLVRVRGRREGDWVQLEVEDNGPGIESRHHSRIFERFYRVDTGRTRAAGGTGLGLSIVRHLVEAMGGEIRLDSSHRGGCCFVVRLKST